MRTEDNSDIQCGEQPQKLCNIDGARFILDIADPCLIDPQHHAQLFLGKSFCPAQSAELILQLMRSLHKIVHKIAHVFGHINPHMCYNTYDPFERLTP